MFKRIPTLAASILLGLAMLCGILWLLATPTQVIRADAPPVTCSKIQSDFTVITTLVGNCYHFVTDTVAIAPGVVVTIAPPPGGTMLYFNSNTQVQVFGTLRALGQPDQPITFTSAMVNPERADWQGILFVDDGNPVGDGDLIQYSTIEYARTGIQGGDEDFIDILSNTFRYNGDGGGFGGAIGGDTDNSIIRNNVIYSNSNGIILNESFSDKIISNTIYNIDQYGVFFRKGSTVGGGDNLIQDNEIYSTALTGTIGGGLRLESGSTNRVISNSIYLNPVEAIYLLGQSGTSVQYNHVYGNGGGSGYVAAVFITGTPDLATNVVSSNVISDTYGDAIEYAAINGDTGPRMWNNALCSIPAYELQNDAGVTADARYNWWGTNTPISGVNYIGLVNFAPPIALSIITSTDVLPADGVSTATVRISFRDPSGSTVSRPPTRQTDPPAPNARQIALATSLGAISPPIVEVDDQGIATATLTSAPTTGVAIITATAFCNFAITSTMELAATNLAITKTAAITQVVAGSLLPYNISYSNTSGITATNVVITDQLPANTTYVGDSSGLSCPACVPGATGLLTWTVGMLSPGVNQSFVLTLSVASGSTACGTPLINRATIGTAAVETTLSDNSASAPTITVVCADVGISKTTALTQVVPGSLLTYTIVYSNAGSAMAGDVLITDSLPAGTAYVTDTSGLPVSIGPGVITWTVGNLNPASSFAFSLILSVNTASTCGTLLTNTAGITTTTPENDVLPNLAVSAPVIVTCADVGIAKLPVSPLVVPGSLLTYTIVYSNGGTTVAYDVLITDSLPAGTTYVTDTSGLPYSTSPGVITWTAGNLNPASSFAFSLTLRASSSLDCSEWLTNIVTITTTTPENNVLPNQAIAQMGVICACDVLVKKDDDVGPTTPNPNAPLAPDKQAAIDRMMQTFRRLSPSAPAQHREFARPGDVVTYTVFVKNMSTYTATQFVLTETLPIYSDYIGYDWTQLDSTRTFTRSVGTLPPGDSRVYYFVVRVQDIIPVRNITNTICGFGQERDLHPEDNCSIEDTPVRPWELRVSKSASECIVPGQPFDYTIRYTNTTTGTTFFNVLITDTLPPLVAYSGGGGWTCNGNVCTRNVPVISPTTNGSLDLPVQLSRSFPITETSITNTVEISGGNRFVLTTPIWTGADLSIVKNDNIGPLPLNQQAEWEYMRRQVYGAIRPQAAQDDRLFAQPGEPITYTILYANNGAGPAHSVVVTEQLPLYTSYVGGGWTHASGAFYTITLGTLPAHGGGELTFIVQVNDPFPPDVDRVINRVDIGGTDAECNLDNNWSADDTPVRQSPIGMGIWATGRDSNNIVSLDPRTMQVISNVTVGGMPFGIARDDQHIYVVNFGSNSLSVLNEAGVVSANIPTGVRPTFVEAMDGCAYVTNYAWPGWGTGGGITRYCPQTGVTQILSNIPGFFGIAQDPIHHHIFAANRGFLPGDPNAGIYMIDGNTLQVTKIITTSEQPYEIAYSLNSNRLYVIIPALNEVWVYDSDGGNFSAWPDYRLPTDVRRVRCQLTDEWEVNGGEGIAIEGDTIYVSNYCAASITVIRDSYTVPVSSTMRSSSFSSRDVTPLPYQVYLPLVMGGNVKPPEPSVIYTIDLQPEAQQQAVPYAAQAACTGYCPKGIAFYGDKIYVSLFRTDSLAVISPMLGYMPPYTVTVMPVTPTGSIMSINQLLGRE